MSLGILTSPITRIGLVKNLPDWRRGRHCPSLGRQPHLWRHRRPPNFLQGSSLYPDECVDPDLDATAFGLDALPIDLCFALLD